MEKNVQAVARPRASAEPAADFCLRGQKFVLLRESLARRIRVEKKPGVTRQDVTAITRQVIVLKTQKNALVVIAKVI